MTPSIILGILLMAVGVLFRYARIERNYFIGYRTFRSMKSRANWVFANREMAKLSFIAGAISIVVGLAFWYSGIHARYVIYLTLGLIFVSIVIVEIRLNKFDRSNNAREDDRTET